MALSSGVWIFESPDGELIIGVTDYGVDDFDGEDWEWSATFDKKNAEILINSLKEEFGDGLSLKEMLSTKFGANFSTTEFTSYCNSLKLVYEIKRMWA